MTVKCVCVLPDTAGPELRIGMAESAANAVWVRSLQGMFVDDPEAFPKEWVTGTYDARTEARVVRYQEASNAGSPVGVVDARRGG